MSNPSERPDMPERRSSWSMNHDPQKKRKDHTEIQKLNNTAGGGDAVAACCAVNPIPLIGPYSKGLLAWQMVLLVCIIYSALVVPFELAFSKQANLYHISAIADIIFILDLAVMFHTKVEITMNNEPVIVGQRDIIARQYMYGGLLVDAISCMPPPYVNVPDSVRFIKLLKLLRIFKLCKILGKRIKISPTDLAMATMVGFLIAIIYLSHLLACMWYGVGFIDHVSSWHTNNGLYCPPGHAPDCVAGPLEQQYLKSLYWAVMTLTTVGYGDISAANMYEMAFSSFVMICGAFIYAIILGQVTVAYSEMNAKEEPLRERLKDVYFFASHHGIAKDLKKRMDMHSTWQWQLYKTFSGYSLLDDFPKELQAEVLLKIHRPMIINVPFFEEVHEPFVKMILPQIKPEICLEDEWVYREGDVGHCMYMINVGEFRIHLKYEASHTDGLLLRGGECFGVNSILPSLKQGIRMQSVQCQSRQAILYLLNRDTVHEALEVFPELKDSLMRFAEDALAQQKLARNSARSFRHVNHILTVDILQGRDLASKDVSGFSDPFCKVKYYKEGLHLVEGVDYEELKPFESESGGVGASPESVRSQQRDEEDEEQQQDQHQQPAAVVAGGAAAGVQQLDDGSFHFEDAGPEDDAHHDSNEPDFMYKTKVMFRNLRPAWNEHTQIEVGSQPKPKGGVVMVEVYDSDIVGADDFMGRVVLKMSDIPTRPHTKWYKLLHRKKSEKHSGVTVSGELKMRFFVHDSQQEMGLCLPPKKRKSQIFGRDRFANLSEERLGGSGGSGASGVAGAFADPDPVAVASLQQQMRQMQSDSDAKMARMQRSLDDMQGMLKQLTGAGGGADRGGPIPLRQLERSLPA